MKTATEKDIEEAVEWAKLKEIIAFDYNWYLENPEEYNRYVKKMEEINAHLEIGLVKTDSKDLNLSEGEKSKFSPSNSQEK